MSGDVSRVVDTLRDVLRDPLVLPLGFRGRPRFLGEG